MNFKPVGMTIAQMQKANDTAWNGTVADSKESHEVHVGNIGMVHSGSNHKEAEGHYNNYVGLSKSGHGRAGGESVTWMKNGNIHKEHQGSREE